MNPSEPVSSTTRTKTDCVEAGGRHAYAIGIEADDGQVYWLSSAQFLSFVHGPNSSLSSGAGAPPERGVLRFGSAEVTVQGSGLARIGHYLSEGTLCRLRGLPWRLRDPDHRPTWIATVTVTLTPDL